MGKRIIIVHVCFSSRSSIEKREWVNSNMELLPHTHFIFIFAVVGNDRSGSNRLCSSNFSGQQNWKRRIVFTIPYGFVIIGSTADTGLNGSI